MRRQMVTTMYNNYIYSDYSSWQNLVCCYVFSSENFVSTDQRIIFKPGKPVLLVHLGTSGNEELCDYAANSHGPLFGTVLEISTGL